MSGLTKMVVEARNIVGESIVYDERRDRLLWVDIIGRAIHMLSLADGAHERVETPDFVTSIGLREDGGAIVGFISEVVLWDFEGPFRPFAAVEGDNPKTRLNEGVVGPDGAFWVGTMEQNFEPDGSPIAIANDLGRLYRIDANGKVEAVADERYGVTNTFAFIPGGLVNADSKANALYRYPFDGKALGPREDFFAGFERGAPDGSCVDAADHIWNCRVAGGSCVIRLSPDGALTRVVDIPPSWPTSCAFAGAQYDRLFVTSARFTMEPEHIAANPHEGGLFEVATGERGRPANRFGSTSAF